MTCSFVAEAPSTPTLNPASAGAMGKQARDARRTRRKAGAARLFTLGVTPHCLSGMYTVYQGGCRPSTGKEERGENRRVLPVTPGIPTPRIPLSGTADRSG